MSDFSERFAALNKHQLQAVKKLEGPLLVLAGPGTGKTTLLTMRIAYILRQTDTIPESILCLTFTESAQKTMQSRLVALIGQDAYRVQIHTFHSFGGWVMRNYPQYFEDLINSQLADDITRYRIVLDIFERLPHYDPLSSTNDGDYLYMSDAMSRISQLKQAAVTPAGLLATCKQDQAWLEVADNYVINDLSGIKIINKTSVVQFETLLNHLETLIEKSEIGRQCWLELRDSLEEAHAGEKVSTKPLTTWKNSWLIKKSDGNYALRYASTLKKLESLSHVYKSYQAALQKQGLTDFDDQLMVLLQNMRSQPDLLAELQERFLYLMADEYQDTNGVQQQILETLADNPVADDKPNIMVVGDDDQAIYGFQGAYSSNVLDFLKRWREVETITLTENYRSTPEIVNFTRTIITQGENRLENVYEYIDKELTTSNKSGAAVSLVTAGSQIESYQSVAEAIRADLATGTEPEQIAVLATQHKYLERFVPYLSHYDIGVSYERRQDVLHEQHIHELIVLSEVVDSLADNNMQHANNLLPELLSFPWWGLKAEQLWEISLAAYRQKSLWLPTMQSSSDTAVSEIAEWLIEQAASALTTPLERMLDILTGHGVNRLDGNDKFCSPYYSYYFLEPNSDQEVSYLLTSLLIIRQHIRAFTRQSDLRLHDFVSYCSLREQSGLPILNDHPVTSKNNAVNLMTAHKAKGLEFESVYILDSQHTVWAKPRGRSSLIVMPPHIARIRSDESADEYLRLFYVALTRAARKLTLTMASNDDNNNPVLPIGWLQAENTRQQLEETIADPIAAADLIRGLTFDWHERIASHSDADWRLRLQDRLQNYRLSPTHLSTFLDVTVGGPRTFLINHLLRFPQGTNPNIAFGNAMHHVMQYLHGQMNSSGSLPNKRTTIDIFNQELAQYNLGNIEQSKQASRGEYTLEALYKHGLGLFKETGQISEVDLGNEGIVIGSARLTGKIDLIDTNSGTIRDYKTGKPVASWPKDGAKSYDALKMHRYRQQLLFYELMIRQSAAYRDQDISQAELIFLESGDHSDMQILRFEYDSAELARLERLIQAAWECIVKLDLPDISMYPTDVTGVRQFEEDLINKT